MAYVIIESVEDHNCPHALDCCYEAYQSISYMNWGHSGSWNAKNFTIKALATHNFNKKNLYIGSIDFMQQVAKGLGLILPGPLNIPKEIEKWADREIGCAYKHEIIASGIFPIFVKPYDSAKLFTGGVLTSEKTFDVLPEVKEDTFLMTSSIEDFVSEYRCFVHKGQLVGMKHYHGDFQIFPNMEIINACIKDYIKSPIAYAIDFGITSSGKTKLIEVNDFWSCGTYGFVGETLILMLRDRWFEIITQQA